MSNQIQIKIEGPKLRADKFLDGAREFLALVQGVAKNVTTEQIEWLVEVDKSSAVIRMKPTTPSHQSELCIDVVCKGMKALRAGVAALPHGFTRENAASARILAGLTDGQDIQAVSIQNGDDSESIPQSIVKVVDKILEGQRYNDFGSIEGKIISLSARHGYICVINDPIEQREITCYLQTDSAQRDAVRGYDKRVMASGLIHYAAGGYPESITVDEIHIFPPISELPTAQDIQAIYEQYK